VAVDIVLGMGMQTVHYMEGTRLLRGLCFQVETGRKALRRITKTMEFTGEGDDVQVI
jgi:hypothetical protein